MRSLCSSLVQELRALSMQLPTAGAPCTPPRFSPAKRQRITFWRVLAPWEYQISPQFLSALSLIFLIAAGETAQQLFVYLLPAPADPPPPAPPSSLFFQPSPKLTFSFLSGVEQPQAGGEGSGFSTARPD